MASDLISTGGRFGDFLKDCEIESLSIESVAQHFLQDAWSEGHMWERWGSCEISDFRPLPQCVREVDGPTTNSSFGTCSP